MWFYLHITAQKKIVGNRIIPILMAIPSLFFICQQWAGNLVTDVIRQPYGWVAIWNTAGVSIAFFIYSGL